MKIIFLLDLQSNELDAVMDLVKTKKVLLDTRKQTEEKEYSEIKYFIDLFLKSSVYSNVDVMLVWFSGKESIVKDLGDEYSDMIVSLSTNKRSQYYTNEIQNVFNKMINVYSIGE